MTEPIQSLPPAFGQAALSNCEREQIHLPGSIQPHGALLVLDGATQQILQASENAADFFGLAEHPVGLSADEICPELQPQVASLIGSSARELPLSFRTKVNNDTTLCDCLLHRNADGFAIAEFLEAGDSIVERKALQDGMAAISDANSIGELCDRGAEAVHALTGYDRVMVYEFDPEGHGSVRAEYFEKDLESYLGQRYPASDIPQIARKLYLSNRIRLLVDVGYEPIAVTPRLTPDGRKELDMSMCFLRSVSPIHTQYLKNMGVAATLVISVVVGGQLWGLIACHHYSPRSIPTSLCAACELLAENFATRIAAFEGNAQAQVNWWVRRIEAHMVEGISRFGDWREALFNRPEHFMGPVKADGAVLFVEHEIMTAGVVPDTHTLRDIREWLTERMSRGENPIATASLGREDPRFESSKEVASGLLAVPISNSSNEFLVWFRPEQLRVDIWGGNPAKAVQMGDDPQDLSPRLSFAKWHQQVEGTSLAWTSVQRNLATRIGQSLADLVMHFRSVRALIIEDQLDGVFKQISSSAIPIVLCGPSRKILVANEAFRELFPPGGRHLASLEDLPGLFANPQECRLRITELCDQRREWRGEVEIAQPSGERLSLLVRGDPVFVSDERIVGYSLMFTSLAEQRAADQARERFQSSIMARGRMESLSLDDEDFELRKLSAAILGNAKLAALEVTDGEDVHSIADMLDSIRSSVARSMELLQHLGPAKATKESNKD